MPTHNRIQAGGFVHCVYFWLNEPDNDDARETFLQHLTHFIDASAYVKSSHIGGMAPSDRDVVEQSYTYCLIATFVSKEDQDRYQTESVHIDFIENAKHLWKKVVVFDSTSIF